MHRLKKGWLCLSLLMICLSVTEASLKAQPRKESWSLAFGTAIDFPVSDLGTIPIHTGVSFEGLASFRHFKYWSANLTWGWSRFNARETISETAHEFDETGLTGGIGFTHGFWNSQVAYRAGLSTVYQNIRSLNSNGEQLDRSPFNWGYQLDAGLNCRFSTWTISPGFRYHSFYNHLDINGTPTSINLNYIAISILVSFSF